MHCLLVWLISVAIVHNQTGFHQCCYRCGKDKESTVPPFVSQTLGSEVLARVARYGLVSYKKAAQKVLA